MWNTDLNLTTDKANVTIKNNIIKNGIYQNDCLSPLLFCRELILREITLRSILNDTDTGYQFRNEKQKVNHLLYVDDLKLLAKIDEELIKQLKMF